MSKLAKTENVQDVMQDILSIRRSIHAFQANKEGKISESAFQTQHKLLTAGAVLSFLFFAIEFLGNSLITRNLLEPLPIANANLFIALAIGLFLALCVSYSYFTVKRAAKTVGDDLESYVRRNFNYLKNLNQISDLTVKFLVISTLLYIGAPNLIAIFLLVFTADYLLQGRYFVFSPTYAQALAVVTVALAAIMFFTKNPTVMWPLLWFFIVTCNSLVQLRKLKRVED